MKVIFLLLFCFCIFATNETCYTTVHNKVYGKILGEQTRYYLKSGLKTDYSDSAKKYTKVLCEDFYKNYRLYIQNRIKKELLICNCHKIKKDGFYCLYNRKNKDLRLHYAKNIKFTKVRNIYDDSGRKGCVKKSKMIVCNHYRELRKAIIHERKATIWTMNTFDIDLENNKILKKNTAHTDVIDQDIKQQIYLNYQLLKGKDECINLAREMEV